MTCVVPGCPGCDYCRNEALFVARVEERIAAWAPFWEEVISTLSDLAGERDLDTEDKSK
jgi:hypothetical protein